jgi:hypothetical protein
MIPGIADECPERSATFWNYRLMYPRIATLQSACKRLVIAVAELSSRHLRNTRNP